MVRVVMRFPSSALIHNKNNKALISQRDISKGMALLDFAAQLRISTKMTNN
jgi:hypothetical protein